MRLAVRNRSYKDKVRRRALTAIFQQLVHDGGLCSGSRVAEGTCEATYIRQADWDNFLSRTHVS